MNLCLKALNILDDAAEACGDTSFFGIRSEDEWFVFNWCLGITFTDSMRLNLKVTDVLENRADEECLKSDNRKDIIYHLTKRSWMDILVGTGVYLDVECVQLRRDEEEMFREHGRLVTAFQSDSSRRYYIHDAYLDAMQEILGDDMKPSIFRPLHKHPSYPHDYRPMLFFDGTGTPRGLCAIASEDNLRNPIDRSQEIAAQVEQDMPELFT